MTFLGKTIEADLSSRHVTAADFDETIATRFLGGRGAGSWALYSRIPSEIDPLSPENLLVLSCGLLTGTEAPASSRLHLSARSPLTGFLGSSNVGGHVGAELRAAGCQTLVVGGAADSPVYLLVTPDGVSTEDASDLWGLDAWRVQEVLRERHGSDARALAIGVGGETGVRYGCVMTERGHAAGRTGMGAVMGSKKLKAIVAVGGSGPRSSDPAVREIVRHYAETIRNAERYPVYSRFSNSGFVNWADETGILATRNYRENRFEGAARIDGSRIIDYVTRPTGCYRCPVHCKAEIRIEDGPYAGTVGERPDIEPIVALGSKCGLDDVEAMLHLYNLCGRLGLDAISAASALAFAMELRDRDIVSIHEMDDIDLTWGNAAAMDTMLHKIARREGFGAVLAEGVARAAKLIGHGAEQYAYHTKGLEITAYDPRGALGTALGYAVSTRGADFTSVYALAEYRYSPEEGRQLLGDPAAIDRFTTDGKAALIKHSMSASAAIDSLGLCKVAAMGVVNVFTLESEAALAAAIRGVPLTAADLFTVGERILNVERLFNLRCGAVSADDTLPAHFLRDGLPQDPHQGATVDLAPMVRQFYATMGWDSEGRPTSERLKQLGIEEM